MSWGLTSVLTGPQEVDDVGMMPQFAQNFQFSRKVTMVIFRGILCVKNPISLLPEINRVWAVEGWGQLLVEARWGLGLGRKERVRAGAGVALSRPFSILMAAFILSPSFLIMARMTWPKFPSPMRSSKVMSSHSSTG